jgi:HlyD family secretion protein
VAQADLEEATVNLGYTTISSPVKGIVLDRRINIGQTVIASLNAPSLFLIAKDLSRLEIWSSVNETDIGSIHEGQKVRFSVGSFPRDTFEGKVAKIRLNASMTQNVVTYTVVIAVDNSSGRLLPYLTVRVQFEVEGREHALLVPNAALRWHPTLQNVIPGAREKYALALRRQTPANGEKSPSESLSKEDASGLVWIRQGDLVQPVEVKTGLSDGVVTEICGSELNEGTEIIVGASRVDSDPDALSILPHTWSEAKK